MLGAKFCLADPQGEAQSWYIEFDKIVTKFETGHYKPYIVVDGVIKDLPENPTKEEMGLFYKKIQSYCITAYKNYIINNLLPKKEESEVLEETSTYKDRTSIVDILEGEENNLRIDGLVEILNKDLKRAKRMAATARERVDLIILNGIVRHIQQLKSKYGNIFVLKDISRKELRNMLIFDIREGMTDTVAEELEKEFDGAPLMIKSKILKSLDKRYLYKKVERILNRNGGLQKKIKSFMESR